MLITGYCDDGGSAKFCVTRLTLAGALDTSFNSTGIKLYSATGQTGDVTRRVRILPGDASFLRTAAVYTATPALALLCRRPQRQRPARRGLRRSKLRLVQQRLTTVNMNLLHVAGDGKVLLGGHCGSPPQIVCMLRTNPNGTRTPLLARADCRRRCRTLAVPVSTAASSPPATSSGKRAVQFNRRRHRRITCVSRFDLGPASRQHCSLDIDDDGFVVKPQTDGLLWLRLLLGFRGNALTQNAVSSGALRASAAAIFDHAYNQCGVR